MRIQKMPFHPQLPLTIPPIIGAATGATPLMAPMTASIFARSCPRYLSAATDRDMTILPAPATPWTSLQATNWKMSRAKIHPRVDSRNRIMAVISGGRRPYLSLTGPKRSCPAASPIMLAVRPNWTMDDEVEK